VPTADAHPIGLSAPQWDLGAGVGAVSEFRWDFDSIDAGVREAIDDYASGQQPHLGGFLTSVMENDLFAAAFQADEGNVRVLAVIACYVSQHVPSEARGTGARVAEWQRRFARPGP
jgi:hypothetical protein